MTHNKSRTIVWLLWGFAFLSYMLRVNISVAQQYMARDLSWSAVQVGYVFTAFLIGYSIFQVPAGALGDRFGPRVVLTVSGVLWGFTTLLTGLLPGLLIKGTAAALSALLFVRFFHGLAEAATYPVAMSAVSIWFQPSRHAFVNSLIFTGSTLGSAFAPPFVSSLMNLYGWRFTFYLSAALPIVLAIVWWKESRGIVRPEAYRQTKSSTSLSRWRVLLAQPSIFVLCSSYLLYCYAISIFVYWLFKYLVDVRQLSIVSSGWANSLPWIAASLALPIFGYISTKAAHRIGALRARRLVATSCLMSSALLITIGARAQSTGLALGAISVCVALLFSTESSYWSTAIELAGEEAGAASGLMNLAGNLGGVLSTALVPFIVIHVGWIYALLSGSLFAVTAALLWFLIKQPKIAGSVPEG